MINYRNQILQEFKALKSQDWSSRALIACLERLGSEGATDGHLAVVKNAWCGPRDEVSIVFRPPWSNELIGLRRWRLSPESESWPLTADIENVSAEEFGAHIANWDVGIPFRVPAAAWRDSSNIPWVGDFETVST